MSDSLPFCITIMGCGTHVQKVLCEIRGVNGANDMSDCPEVQEVARRVAGHLDDITRYPGFKLRDEPLLKVKTEDDANV